MRSDKRRFPPYGLQGGHPGTPSQNIINPGPRQRILPVLMSEPVMLKKGDVFRHVLAGGGGHGPPLARDPALVLHDVIQERVTPKHARDAYGIVIVEGAGGLALDPAGTAALRARRAA